MFGRNIDFFAVCLIALGLGAFSKVEAFRPPQVQVIRLQTVRNTTPCPLDAALSHLADFLNQ